MNENTENKSVETTDMDNIIKGVLVKIPFEKLVSQSKSGDIRVAISSTQAVWVSKERTTAGENGAIKTVFEPLMKFNVFSLETGKASGLQLNSDIVVKMLTESGCVIVKKTERPKIDFTKLSK